MWPSCGSLLTITLGASSYCNLSKTQKYTHPSLSFRPRGGASSNCGGPGGLALSLVVFPTLAHSSQIIPCECATCFLQGPWLITLTKQNGHRRSPGYGMNTTEALSCPLTLLLRAVSRAEDKEQLSFCADGNSEYLPSHSSESCLIYVPGMETRCFQVIRIWINQYLW